MQQSVILRASFFACPPLAFTGFFGAQNICFKKAKTVFFCASFHFVLRWNPDILQVFSKMAGLTNRAF
jgi:hypothetical protein